MLESIAGDAEAIARFEREAKAVSRMDHPNVGAVFALEHDAGKTFLAMAYYAGETLRQRLDRERLSLADAVRFSLEIARGLEHAHANGVTHRDVKPANIFLARQANGTDTVKLLDFGLARLEDASRMMTRPGATTGTLMYMAPEQMRGETVAHRVDVWAWGAVTFEMLAGRPAFAQENIGALLTAILHSEPEPLEALCPEAPAALAELVRHALRKNPTERVADMTEVVRRLEAAVHAGGPAAAPLAKPAAPRLTPEAFVVEAAKSGSSTPDHPAFVSGADWDAPAATLPKPAPKRPWWAIAPAALALAVGSWAVLRGPTAPDCKPLEKPGTALARMLEVSQVKLPMFDCGAYLHGRGQANPNTYPGANRVRREVIATPSGTVVIADAVDYGEARQPVGLFPLPGKVEQDINFSGGGHQWRAADGTAVSALGPYYIGTEVKNGKLEVTSTDDPDKRFVFLMAYQPSGDQPIEKLAVTTNDDHEHNFAGVLLDEQTAIFLGPGSEASAANFDVSVPPGIGKYIIGGLQPPGNWKINFEPNRNWWSITLKPGRDGAVSDEGVVVLQTPEPK